MPALLDIIKKTAAFLAERGVDSPRLNAEHLIGQALGLGRMQLYLQFERELAESELEKIRPLVRRRAQREPLQHILGETEFFGLRLKTDRRALVPRPETELLVELITDRWETAPKTILDLGTGSGCIALALASHWPTAQVTAVDGSPDALALASENATALNLGERVALKQSDWFSILPDGARYDLIVSNPPYLSAEETKATAPEVRDHEPHTALTAEENGLADLRRIMDGAASYLAPGGMLALETGIGHHAALLKLATETGFARVESRPDLTQRDRFVFAWLN